MAREMTYVVAEDGVAVKALHPMRPRDSRTNRPWPWHEKVRAEIGRRAWSAAELARRVNEDGRKPISVRSLRRHVSGVNAPRYNVIARIARALHWPLPYMTDETRPYPPQHDDAWILDVLDMLDANARKVVSRLNDPAVALYLADQLDQWDRWRAAMEGRGMEP